MSKRFWINLTITNVVVLGAAAGAVGAYVGLSNQFLDTSRITNPNNSVGYLNLNENIINKTYDENAFIKNAQEVANDDSVLFYSISWVATLHKMAPIAHILKVLELNNNKKIFLYVTNNLINKYNLDLIKQRYPSFNYKVINDLSSNGTDYANSFQIPCVNEIKNDIKNNNLENVNKRIYIPDYFILSILSNLPTSNLSRAQNLYNNYFYLAKTFKEINLISDGTATILAFGNNLYTFYKNNDELNFDRTQNKFVNAITLQKELNNYDEISFTTWIKKDKKNAMLYLTTLLSSGMTQEQGLSKINLYMPYTGMLRDYNNTTSKKLDKNIEYNEYFNPLDFSGLNIIDLIDNLNKTSFDLLWNTFKLPLVNDLEKNFNNHKNLVYGGALLSDDNIITNEANKILKILESQNDLTNVKLWFKPHPRENDDNLSKLINKVNEISKNKNSQTIDYTNKIDFLNKSIPFEFLLMTSAFKNDSTQNRTVEIYTTYSTLYFTIIASKKKDLIKKILLTKTQKDEIVFEYGTPTPSNNTTPNSSQSICFNEDIFWII
ncbi:MAG: hypothetical protein K2K73_01890 [Ureaplasma sp.]|nr:hypothetical protein [Ureaplasma sp.]